MLESYLPALVILLFGMLLGGIFAVLNRVLGPKRIRRRATREAYECGLPSEVQQSFRFGISFYLVAMLFILFDIEVILVYPVALLLEEFGIAALVKIIIFVALLGVAFIHQWRRGALEWK